MVGIFFVTLLLMNQKVNIKLPHNIELFVKREDLIHPLISGNKFRKLKYNLLEAKKCSAKIILTFGGAYSNHILATAAAGKINGLRTIGVIRGEELKGNYKNNPTLLQAEALGMHLHFIDRKSYKNKDRIDFIDGLKIKFGDFYLVPEGGTNELAIKGCEEIILEEDTKFDFICCAVGTGGTISGIINSAFEHQKIIGFPALKGDFLSNDIRKFVTRDNWHLILEYHFGGYGKTKEELISFLNQFYGQTAIPLDPIYTGKMMFGIIDLIEKDYFPNNSKILAIHTGGLQGVIGVNKVLKEKEKEFLIYEE